MAKLTEKQKRFIDFYVETANATESARRAGYKGKNLNRIGSENLSKLDSHIKRRLEDLKSDRVADADEVLQYLTSIMRNEKTEQVVVTEDGEATTIDKEISIKDRTKAAELLGKRYGVFTDKVEVKEVKGDDILAGILKQMQGSD